MKKIFIILLLLFVTTNAYADQKPGLCSLYISPSSNSIEARESVIITVASEISGTHVATDVEIDLGNGVKETLSCHSSGFNCSGSVTTSNFVSPGNFNIRATVTVYDDSNYSVVGSCFDSAPISVSPIPCRPDGCNMHCPPSCTVAEDPDCWCQSGDGCCAPGCDEASDSDCAGAKGDGINPLNDDTLGGLMFNVINVIFWISMIVFPLGIIAGGFIMNMSAFPNSVATGKKIILYSSVIFAIMIVIKLMSYYIKPDLTFH